MTVFAALILSQFVHELSLPNWWIHPTGIVLGLALYAVLLLYKRNALIAFEAGQPMTTPTSGLSTVEYYWRLTPVAFVLANPFEFVASLFR